MRVGANRESPARTDPIRTDPIRTDPIRTDPQFPTPESVLPSSNKVTLCECRETHPGINRVNAKGESPNQTLALCLRKRGRDLVPLS